MVQLVPVLEKPLDTLCEVATDAFTDYIVGSIAFSPQLIAAVAAMDGVDLNLCRFIVQDDKPVGFAMFARRGWTIRLMAFGVIREWQEKKIGRQALALLIQESKERGEKKMVLECFEQNERGIRLYESLGFKTLRRLVGFEGENLAGEQADLIEIDPAEVAAVMSKSDTEWLPWQCHPSNSLRTGPPSVAYRLGDAFAAITNPEAEVVSIRSLGVLPSLQGKGEATRIVGAILAHHPGKKWRINEIVPEEFAPIFEKNGLSRKPLNQVQMELCWDR